MEATEMFLIRHQRLHAQVERLTEGLSEEQIRACVHPRANSLAWILWHIARAEDAAVNLLIAEGPQVLTDAWAACLNVERRDVGTGMTMAEVLDLSAHVQLPALLAYGRAVGKRTSDVVAALRPADLDHIVSSERVRQVIAQTVAGPTGARLQELWQGTTRGHFLVWLPLTHNYEHVGQAELLRGLLGRAGRF